MKKLRVLPGTRHNNDYVMITTAALLVVFGLVVLASASSHVAQLKFGDSYYYLKHQLLSGLLLGMVGFFLGTKIYYRYLEKLAILLLAIGVLLLILVYTPLGVVAGGATRGVAIGPVSFQPSEVLKFVFIIYLAAWLSHNKERQHAVLGGLLPFLIILGGVLFLLVKQPATSTAAILALIAVAMYFFSGARLTHIISIAILVLLAFGLLIYLTPYRLNRIKAFLNPEANPQTTGYQINQAKIAIGAGGLWGVGYGQSTTKIKYLPEPIHDSIFAVIAEEFGFVGSVTLIGLLLLLTSKMFLIAKHTKDKFGQLLLIGFGLLIALQSFVNIGAISGLLPLTGLPLPFISYGGTSLVVFMTIVGIANNIAKHA